MLQKVSKQAQMALDLADKIEGLNEDEFDMSNWSWCICGWLMRMNGHISADGESHGDYGARELGITYSEANRLFSNDRVITRHDAARKLRHLAITGEVA